VRFSTSNLVRDHGVVVGLAAGKDLNVGLLDKAAVAGADLLGGRGLAGLLGSLEGSKGLLLGDKGLAAAALSDMLVANADTLPDNALLHWLVDNHANTTWGDVPNNTSATVVVLVWHTLTNGRVCNNINELADLVGGEDGADGGDTVLAELLGEEVAGAALKTVGVNHSSENL
jgi:hypothetical protein